MKNTFKNVGIIAIVAVIGFALASCLTLGGGGDETAGRGFGGGAFGGYLGASYDSWPSNDVWAGYQLSGLRQPAAARFGSGQVMGESLMVSLEGGRAVFDDLINQVKRINGWEGPHEQGHGVVLFMKEVGDLDYALTLTLSDSTVMLNVGGGN